jgi:opacity protein-like surface antigen
LNRDFCVTVDEKIHKCNRLPEEGVCERGRMSRRLYVKCIKKVKEEKMTKKGLLVLVLACVLVGGVFAQSWYNSYAPGIEGSKFFINGGVGFGILPYKMSLPPISVSAEYGLSKIPLSLGAYFGITGYNEDLGDTSYKATMVGCGARGSYHFNFLKNLDPYVSLTLGWLVRSEEVKTTGGGEMKRTPTT